MSEVLGILPARGGSKGLPGKNVRDLYGKPLIAWAGSALAECQSVSRAICSTDDDEIAAAARACGLEVPFKRPDELASDTAKVADVLVHVLDEIDPQGLFTHVALVQATSPTVTSDIIDEAIRLAENTDADTVVTGFKATSAHPSIMFRVDDEQVQWFLQGDTFAKRRQEFETIYIRTGLVYVVKTSVLRETGGLYGAKVRNLEVRQSQSLTIDDEFDFSLAEFLMRNGNDRV